MKLTSNEILAELTVNSRIADYTDDTDARGFPCVLFTGDVVEGDADWDDVKRAIAAAGFSYETDADGVFLTA